MREWPPRRLHQPEGSEGERVAIRPRRGATRLVFRIFRLDAGCHLIEMCTGQLVTYEKKKAFIIAYESTGKKKTCVNSP